ncbi:MAG: bifunctional phosphopantothenoylcysteine decarboxylase/phosphopantothenate--cysteine ligase CoaBC [Lachnospiraceae bacterium]|nr:bifunctional phosphopantothenoylcysteine decarboxylase/phosphopantothenate--cysteine ligase CoaBC [Lachnospiraceae bacterium]
MLKGKRVVLGVTGSIAAYKIANLASALVKLRADVHVIMTKNATNFINPITFETLTKNKCIVETFDRNFVHEVEHVSLADSADIMMIAPASANIIAKMANGIADDMLSTTYLAMRCPVIVAPAMNVNMYNNPIVQDNIEKLKKYNNIVIEPNEGYLACGYTGKGKMPEPEELLSYIIKEIGFEKDLIGKKILITAGPTREAIDPVRFITNHSTGKMGYAIAEMAMLRGADVTLVSGPVNIKKPGFVKSINVVSARDMFEAVKSNYEDMDVIIKTAAVADYTPLDKKDEKIKKSENDSDLNIKLERTTDILNWLGHNRKEGQIICGFSMETQNMLENSKKKLEKKNADIIAANSLRDTGAGFGTDTNHLVLIKKDGIKDLPLMSKRDAASALLDEIKLLMEHK